MDLRDITEFFRDCLGYIITLFIIIFIFTFIVSFQPVAGNSMIPTLEEGNVSLVSKLSYAFGDVKRNDVVVVKQDKKRYIKRVIGLPGEKIDYLNGILYINDAGIIESIDGASENTTNFLFEDICPKEKCSDNKIPDDMYLVLGDNRKDSFDSRDSDLGLVSIKQIKGKAFFTIYPLNKIGKII